MKFLIEKREILPYVVHLNNIVPAKNTMPILTNYLIKADENENQLVITTTDLDITAICTIKANVMKSGVVAVSARRLMEILSRMPEEILSFLFEEDELLITSSSAKFDLHCAEVNQFPLIPEIDLSNAAGFDAVLFRKMVISTAFAVSNDSNRPIFNGINWVLEPEFQMMSATDGKKIAEFKLEIDTPVEERIEKIIPTKGLNFLDKVITEEEKNVDILIEENKVVFNYEQYLVISHVIEGRYPDYSKAIPKNNDNILIISRKSLKDAINRVSLLSTEDTFKIHISLSKDEFILDSENREEGEAREKMNDFEYNGKDLQIAFNYKYLISVLNVIETEKVEIRFGSSNEAVLIFNVNLDAKYHTRYLLMPLRLL